jgi:hypothetical protein
MRAEFERLEHRHRRAATELAGLVVGGGQNAAPVLAGDRQRKPAQRRIIPFFDGRVEAVHVDVDDLPHDGVMRQSTCGRMPPLRFMALGKSPSKYSRRQGPTSGRSVRMASEWRVIAGYSSIPWSVPFAIHSQDRRGERSLPIFRHALNATPITSGNSPAVSCHPASGSIPGGTGRRARGIPCASGP